MKPLQALGERIRPICERFWLFTIAGFSLAIICFVAVAIVIAGSMPEGAGELFASMVTGLLLVVQKVIEAQQTRKAMEQLHQSAPASTDTMNVSADQVKVEEK